MILYAIGILSIYSAGYVVRKAVFRGNAHILTRVEKVGLDFGFGSGSIALIYFYLSFCGIRLSRTVMCSVAAFFLVIAAISGIYGLKNKKNVYRGPLRHNNGKSKLLNAALIAIIAISISVIFFRSLYYPMYEWASRSCFGFKAKIINNSGTIYDRSLLDKEFVMEHPEYPLLVPMLEDWMYTVMQTDDDRFGKSFLPFMALAFLCLMYSVQRKFCSATHCLVFTALYSVTYVFVYRFACAEADAPLAFYYFGAGAYLFLWICVKKVPYLVSSALFTSFAVFTKNEATSFLLILSACLCIWLILDGGSNMRKRIALLAMYAGIAVLLSVPWLVYRFNLPKTDILVNERTFFNENTVNTVFAKLGRTTAILNNFVLDIVLKTRKWNLFWIIFFVSQVLYLKKIFRKPVVYLAFIVWATLVLYYLMFVVVDLELAHMLIGMDRFALQVSGLAMLLISLLVCEKEFIINRAPDPIQDEK